MNKAVKILNPSHKRSRTLWAAAAALGAALVLPGCTSQQTQGAASSYLIIDSMVAARGNAPDEESGVLDSDVLHTLPGGATSVFPDLARFTLRLGMKDPGSPSSPSEPTSANFITVNRFHVKFVRADGRNVQGVDVPFEFDGAATATVRAEGAELVVTLVRQQSKFEAPLMALRGLGSQILIATIAEVTLYGKDQAGRDVSVTGSISVNFADFA